MAYRQAPPAHETLLRFSVSGGDRSALVALLLSSPGVGPAENCGIPATFARLRQLSVSSFSNRPPVGTLRSPTRPSNPPAADLSIILVDAAAGLTPEVRRHVAMARGIGSRHSCSPSTRRITWDGIARGFRRSPRNSPRWRRRLILARRSQSRISLASRRQRRRGEREARPGIRVPRCFRTLSACGSILRAKSVRCVSRLHPFHGPIPITGVTSARSPAERCAEVTRSRWRFQASRAPSITSL